MALEVTTSAALPTEVVVKRSDPVYNAHGYLTKVPIAAIEPFILALSQPGELVLDPFAGSGMTGVAAVIHGRRARLRDISELGRHIGLNFLNLVDSGEFRVAAASAVEAARDRIGNVYGTRCERCGEAAELSRTTWTMVYECSGCSSDVNYYRALERAGWRKPAVRCPTCGSLLQTRGARRVREEPAIDTVACSCSMSLAEQDASDPIADVQLDGLMWPDVEIGSDRQMFAASALAKNELQTTARFFSRRNLAALAALRDVIGATDRNALRQKLFFAFTAILARASKRYQWSRKRPLNAANQHYYVAPVFLEWNVFDLFTRKVEAVIRSDEYILGRMGGPLFASAPDVEYRIGSAARLDLEDNSVDYIFTDPPFGSNIFYSDMNLFQEVWLGRITDHTSEAVVDRSGNGTQRRTTERYERLITDALRECHRVLKAGRRLSLVFSNSDGRIWALVQRSVREAGFVFEPDGIALLDKGQRSVKGLASGFENVVTVDLILTMRKADEGGGRELSSAPLGALESLVEAVISDRAWHTPSHVYVEVVRHYLSRGWDVTEVSMRAVVDAIRSNGYEIDAPSGRLRRGGTFAPPWPIPTNAGQ